VGDRNLTTQDHNESANALMSRMVAWNTSGIAASNRQSPAWHVPFTVRQQVLWPDRFGYFPNDVGSQPGFRKRQPLLRDHPLTYPRLEGRSSGRIRR